MQIDAAWLRFVEKPSEQRVEGHSRQCRAIGGEPEATLLEMGSKQMGWTGAEIYRRGQKMKTSRENNDAWNTYPKTMQPSSARRLACSQARAANS